MLSRSTLSFARRVAIQSLLVAGPLSAVLGQTPTLAGRVVDTAGRAIDGATLSVVGTALTTTSDTRGEFRLGLAPGTYTIRARHIGFAPAEASISLRLRSEPITIRLTPAPVSLRGVYVQSERGTLMAQTVTTETVRQVPPLAEPDVFRAVTLLPMVSQPNDLKGRIHLAGGSSDETGIRLDGHPLQDPFHLLGVLGAFNVAALERADVLIHHLPPSEDGRLSGVVDLESRHPSSVPHGEVVVSLLSVAATAITSNTHNIDVLAAARQTYIDEVLARFAGNAQGVDQGQPVPRYGDGLFRIGYSPSVGSRTELLGFITRDQLRPLSSSDGAVPGVRAIPLTWGEALLGIRSTLSQGSWDVSARGSVNRYAVDLRRGAESIAVRRDWMSAGLEVRRGIGAARVVAGANVDSRAVLNQWWGVGSEKTIFSPQTPQSFSGGDAQTLRALYGDAEVPFGLRWLLSTGGRLSTNGGQVRPAPRLSVLFQQNPNLSFAAAYDRRLQYDAQIEEPIEGSVNAPVFLLDRPRIADIGSVTARTEHGDGQTRLTAGFQSFVKRYRDRATLPLVIPSTGHFPIFDRVRGRSFGVAVSGEIARHDATVVQANYTFQRSLELVDGEWSPTTFDAPHSLSVFGSMRALWGMTLNAAFAAHSGAPVTPPEARLLVPNSTFDGSFYSRYILGDRNSIRTPAFQRLDLGVRRSWMARGAEWTLSIQAMNALYHRNQLDFDWFAYFCAQAGRCRAVDTGRGGLPIVPSLGLEVRW